MHIVVSRQFDEIEAFQFGYGPVGRPFMSVYVYAVDGVIIDTGQSNMRKYVIEQLRNTQPHKILLTHHHEDHSGNAFALGRFHQIDIFGHAITAEKMAANRKILPYQRYIWGKSEDVKVKPFGSLIESGRFRFRPIHTPGHSKDHTVFLEDIVGQIQRLKKQGLSDNAIIKLMDSKQDRWVKLMTMGDVSSANMLKSALRGGSCLAGKIGLNEGQTIHENTKERKHEKQAN
jgi:hypothetical protein